MGHTHTVGEERGLVQRGVRDQASKLLAADPREQIAWPQQGGGHPAEGCDDDVAGLMPELVVDLLEPIEIEQQQRNGLAGIPGSSN